MFSGRKSAEKRREDIRLADQAVGEAMHALSLDDIDSARQRLAEAPKTHYADMGWKVGLATAMVEMKAGRRR